MHEDDGVITQNVPRLQKVNPKGNSKNHFRKKLDFLSREGSLKYKFNKARNRNQYFNIMQMVETTHITIGQWSQINKDNTKLSYMGFQQRQDNHPVTAIHLFQVDKKEA